MIRALSRTVRIAALSVAAAAAIGCTHATSGDPPAFVGRLWVSTDAGAAPGTLRVFLPDGTLLMDSCGETYRLVRWASVSPDRITWDEDTATIDADVVRSTEQDLHLRLHLGREVKDEQYRRADAPYVCPETRAESDQPRREQPAVSASASHRGRRGAPRARRDDLPSAQRYGDVEGMSCGPHRLCAVPG